MWVGFCCLVVVVVAVVPYAIGGKRGSLFMPPEQLPPWDRFKDKRHDRPPPPDAALAQTRARWRDAGYHGGPARDFDARRPLGEFPFPFQV